jgi:hypothetical protein
VNQTAYDLGRASSHATATAETGALWREARKDGRVVLTLRCSRNGEAYVVACDAYPVSAAAGEPPEHRTYAFGDLQDAELFVNEAARALEYLGCTIQ